MSGRAIICAKSQLLPLVSLMLNSLGEGRGGVVSYCAHEGKVPCRDFFPLEAALPLMLGR